MELAAENREETIETLSDEENLALQETSLTDAKSNPLKTVYLEYSDDLPEYPRTDEHGFTYVVQVHGLSKEEAEAIVQDIQYSRHMIQGVKKNIKSSFLNCHVSKRVWKCSGASTCQYLKPFLRTLHHTYLDEETWAQIREHRQNAELLEQDERKRNALSFYRAKQDFFKKHQPCQDFSPTCRLKIHHRYYPSPAGLRKPFLGCSNREYPFLNNHWSRDIQGYTTLDLEFLEELFNGSVSLANEGCDVIEPLTSRRKWCDRDHVQGPGRMEPMKCDVTFTSLVPVDIKATPYVVFTSHGVHKHPPPPPHKPPELVLKGIERIIALKRDPTMTLAQFMRSPELEEFCMQYNAKTPAEIHASFCNIDRISAIIQKQRITLYPSGQYYNGVVYLYNTNPSMREYIQDKFFDDGNLMIICAFKEQISLLVKLKSFEVDMSYKRLRGKKLNEVVFATYLTAHSKIVTLMRVYTNQESTNGYYLLFKRVFAVLERVLGQPIQFNSIHLSGINAIVADMDSKQYTGLGQYLQEIDPQHRPVLWQLQSIIVFCRVHFFRNISEAIGQRNKGSLLWSRMAALIDCKSAQDYDDLVNILCGDSNPNVRTWAEQKKQPVIRSGLNKYHSNIPEAIWDSIRNNTNAAEQSHHKINAGGTRLPLVEALQNSYKLDRQDVLQYINRTAFGIHHSYRTTNMQANYQRDNIRVETRKRQRAESLAQTSSSSNTRGNRQETTSSRAPSTTSSRPVLQRSNFDKQQQDFELKRQELILRDMEEAVRAQQLKNEEKELELMERRARFQQEFA